MYILSCIEYNINEVKSSSTNNFIVSFVQVILVIQGRSFWLNNQEYIIQIILYCIWDTIDITINEWPVYNKRLLLYNFYTESIIIVIVIFIALWYCSFHNDIQLPLRSHKYFRFTKSINTITAFKINVSYVWAFVFYACVLSRKCILWRIFTKFIQYPYFKKISVKWTK